ncbi:PorP/SprF family type IX secretion system membrane protein [Chitinophagaceae bacterium MMS25-I14]
MKIRIYTAVLLASVCCGIASKLQAQDIHFSQFMETAILRNPALTGIFSEDYKVGAIYRNQWASIGKPFKTGQISAEMRFPVGREAVDYVSIGLLGYYDKAGSINFQTTGFYPALNYNKSLEDSHSSYLSVGFTGGYVMRSIDISKMTFDNQYQNPGGGSGEQLPASQLTHWDLGAGVSFNSSFGQDNKNSYYLGVSGYHFTHPKQSFYDNGQEINLNTRWNVNGGLNFSLDDAWSVIAQGNYMLQGAYQETIVGGMIRWSRFNNENRRDFAFSAGSFYRFKDAIIPMVKIEYKGQAFSLSYDVNNSSLKSATNLKGGFEISVFTSGFFQGGTNDRHMCPRF